MIFKIVTYNILNTSGITLLLTLLLYFFFVAYYILINLNNIHISKILIKKKATEINNLAQKSSCLWLARDQYDAVSSIRRVESQ